MAAQAERRDIEDQIAAEIQRLVGNLKNEVQGAEAREAALARALTWIPFTAPVIMPLRLSLVPVPASQIALSLAVSAITCVLAIWLSSRIYRVGILLYGKRATMPEVARWVRRAWGCRAGACCGRRPASGR